MRTVVDASTDVIDNRERLSPEIVTNPIEHRPGVAAFVPDVDAGRARELVRFELLT
jgi:hypothetical protein